MSPKYVVDISRDALKHLSSLAKFDESKVLDAIEKHLSYEPQTITRNRKEMRSNLIATWELRVGDLRVYYDVNEPEHTVFVRAVGIKKQNRLFIGGEEVDLT